MRDEKVESVDEVEADENIGPDYDGVYEDEFHALLGALELIHGGLRSEVLRDHVAEFCGDLCELLVESEDASTPPDDEEE